LARRKGFASTMERHPEMLHTLRHKIKSHHRHKGEQQGLTAGQYKKKRLEHLHELYSRLEQ
jgi:hypothetical protein